MKLVLHRQYHNVSEGVNLLIIGHFCTGMDTIIIFIPTFLYSKTSGILCGVVREQKKVKTFYIIDLKTDTDFLSRSHRKLGFFKVRNCQSSKSTKGEDNWLSIASENNELILKKVVSSGRTINLSRASHVICILYELNSFKSSELLKNDSRNFETAYADHFIFLRQILVNVDESGDGDKSWMVHDFVLDKFVVLVSFCLKCLSAMSPVLSFTSTGLQVYNFLDSLLWVLQNKCENRKMTLKVRSYVVATVVDICCGFILLQLVISPFTLSLSQSVLDMAEMVVATMRNLLDWLMGVPAGLKLNYSFNNMLGKFFQYHINLWWMFLVASKPFLDLAFQALLWLGYMGVTFQLCIISDLLALVSFHAYCIYVYAARLYNIQLAGLIALWRLFIGRKYNPLRCRVDSCHYTTDQLFVGTLAFTILLFLLPTTFLYYAVFTVLRVVMLGLGGLLSRVTCHIRALPLYASTLWILRSVTVTRSVCLNIAENSSSGPLWLSVRPVQGSWCETVNSCLPDIIIWPPPLEFQATLKMLVFGKLIYPI